MKKQTKRIPRNANVLAMTLRVRASKFHDKRSKRGGSKNKQKEYRDENI